MSQSIGSNNAVNPVKEDGVIDGSIIGASIGGASALGIHYGSRALDGKSNRLKDKMNKSKRRLDGTSRDDKRYDWRVGRAARTKEDFDKHEKWAKPMRKARHTITGKDKHGVGLGRRLGGVGAAAGAIGLIGMGVDAMVGDD